MTKRKEKDSEIRLRIRVRGRVQGVWYRGSTRDRALELDLVGWAKNLPDGTVEILAQGASPNVKKLLEWCAHGPSGARVDGVDSQEEGPGSELVGFAVR